MGTIRNLFRKRSWKKAPIILSKLLLLQLTLQTHKDASEKTMSSNGEIAYENNKNTSPKVIVPKWNLIAFYIVHQRQVGLHREKLLYFFWHFTNKPSCLTLHNVISVSTRFSIKKTETFGIPSTCRQHCHILITSRDVEQREMKNELKTE